MDQFIIYVDRLKSGKVEKISGALSSSDLGFVETELRFPEEILVSAEVYLSEEHLVMHVDVQTHVLVPCSICNELFPISIVVSKHYHTEPLDEISSRGVDLKREIRDVLLLQVPQFAECNQRKCPERAQLSSFLKDSRE